MQIASYNIHRCVGTDRRCDVQRVARVILEMGCDMVGLQEVESRPGARPESLQLQFLARATGMRAVNGFTRHVENDHYGNALLTTYEIGEVRRHDLTLPGKEPRGALDVELLAAGLVVRVIVTHLGLGATERRFQVRKLVTLMTDMASDLPLVVLGDINEWLPFGRPLRWLHALLGRAPARASFPVWAPLLALDRIWCRPAAALTQLEVHRSPISRVASDHFPLRAMLGTPA